MKKHRTLQYMAVATILFLIAIAASCQEASHWTVPDHIDLGAVRFAARGMK